MADSLSDMIKELGEKSGSGVLAGAEGLRESLKQMAASFEEGSEETFNASKRLQEALNAITSNAVTNIRQTKKLLRNNSISAKTANLAIKRQIKIIGEVTETIGKESKTRELGIKDFENMHSAVMEVNEGLRDEISLIAAKVKGEKAASLERTVIARAEQREREVQRKLESKGRKEEVKDFFGGLEGRIGAGNLATGAFGAARSQIKSVGGESKSAGGRLAALGVLGVGAALISKAGAIQTRALNTLAGTAANFGLSARGLNDELKITESVLGDVRSEAIMLGLDADQMTGLITSIGTATGKRADELKAPMMDLMKLAHAGVASTEELAEELTYQMNTVDKTAEQAREGLMAIAGIGRGSSIRMDDFFKSVKTTAGAVDALTTNHEGLAKALKVTIDSSDKLGLSYDRRVKASQGLTQALTASYNLGFATINVERDLALAMKSENAALATQASKIKANLDTGLITQVRAAEMLKEVGGTTDPSVIAARMEDAVNVIRTGGSLEMVNAQLGTNVSADQLELLKEISKAMSETGDFASAMAKVSGARGKAAIEDFTKQVRERRATGGNLMNATMEQLEASFASALVPILEVISGALKNIAETVGMISRFFGKSPEEVKRAREDANKQLAEESKKETARIGTNILVDQLGKLGQEQGMLEDDEAFIRRTLGKDTGVQESFRKKMRGGVHGASEVGLREAFKSGGYTNAQIEQILTNIDQGRMDKAAAGGAGGAPTGKKITITDSKLGSDGKETENWKIENANAGKKAEKTNNRLKEGAGSTARRAGI